ncbi:MAG: hypothetical protein IJL71_00695 [Oscillospiraceae bacterium]|nr:hypothetical protein [Oscillospiraceae bacterium]
MKKIIAFLMVICVIAALFAGCSSKGNPITDAIQSQSEPSEPAVEETPFEPGAVNGDTYENKYFGIGFKGEGWIFETEEELAEENGVTAEMTDEEIRDLFNNSDIWNDMGAESADSSSNVYLAVENLVLSNSADLDENKQADLYENELKATVEELQGENLVVTRGIANIGDDSHPVVNLEYDYSSLHIYQRGVFIKEGNYLACITITSLDPDGPDQVTDMFYKI